MHPPAIRCRTTLRVKKRTTYRDLVTVLIESFRNRDAFDLDSIPAPSKLCKAFDCLGMAVWRVLQKASLGDHPLNCVANKVASRYEQVHASAHFTKRTKLTIQLL